MEAFCSCGWANEEACHFNKPKTVFLSSDRLTTLVGQNHVLHGVKKKRKKNSQLSVYPLLAYPPQKRPTCTKILLHNSFFFRDRHIYTRVKSVFFIPTCGKKSSIYNISHNLNKSASQKTKPQRNMYEQL